MSESDGTGNTDDSKPDSSSDGPPELGPEFGSTYDYDATASASLSDSPVAPEPGAIGAPGTGPGWNTYSGVGNGPGWSDAPTYPPTENGGSQFDTGQQAYGGQNYTEPGQPVYGQPSYGQPQYGQPQYGQPQYGQPNYAQAPYGGYQPAPGYGPTDPMAPYGRDPISGEPLSDKSKTTAGLLQILIGFLGICGVGRLYIGSTGIGLTQLLLVLAGFATIFVLIGFFIVPIVWIWAFVDGIMMLTGSVRDPQGRQLRN
ncbi:TM2 domain-containing protein [Antrihabitans cavernicola]|uniref:TM2 domain-containing protein n=1 Tax=Antrihabitans cavernicola TaxID=2495913 RepID=A0A5A7S939_9NOCA|nr:TM2 domain-containing protein [Spelaeibacter cavernicola]KAA0021055.1 TM2 domain-containing protein [Spelaeibacter cavernicola]